MAERESDGQQPADFMEMLDSPGMEFLNRLRARGFSLNIFRMNALELVEATRKARDPDWSLALMSERRSEAGLQSHKELSRHIHNFLASAMTLVDHTRVFMGENYANTSVQSACDARIETTLAVDPVVKFVQGLRNYMLHKGLPNVQLFMHFEQDPGSPELGAQVTTGVRFATESLGEWSGWTAPAKRYIARSGKHIDVHRFVDEYCQKIEEFHRWLDSALRQHHAPELAALAALQELQTVSDETRGRIHVAEGGGAGSSAAFEEISQGEYVFPPAAARLIDELSSLLASKVRELDLPQRGDSFTSQRPVAATLNADDAIGDPVLVTRDSDDEDVIAFLREEGRLFGFRASDFADAEDIFDLIHRSPWAKEKISRGFLSNFFLTWVRENFRKEVRGSFADAVSASGLNAVNSFEFWAPVANMEIEASFEFGPVKFSPITAEKIDELEQMVASAPGAQAESLQKFFANIRQKFQGLAAVVIAIEAEPQLAEERAMLIAADAVSLIRFFAPGASVSGTLCPIALLGSEILPTSTALLIKADGFSLNTKLTARQIARWRLRRTQLPALEAIGFREAANLVSSEKLSEFASSVRASLIAYSKGVTFADPIDRLSYALSALESVYLRHAVEPADASVANRLSIVLSKSETLDVGIGQNVRYAYRLAKQYRTAALSVRDDEAMAIFIYDAYEALRIALQNMHAFETKAEFIDAIDRLGERPTAQSDDVWQTSSD